MPRMTVQEVLEHFRGVVGTARACGIKPSSVSGWLAAGEIPIDRQCQIEVITGTRLVADRQKLNMLTPQQQTAGGTKQRQYG